MSVMSPPELHFVDPGAAGAADDDAFDLNACEQLMRGGSKTFFAASLVLPRRVRCAATALYAFCRVADDAIDLSDDKPAALVGLRDRLARIDAGRPAPLDADRAMAAVMREHHIPLALPDALLEGFAWDAEGRQYETLDDLYDYAARVAGTVGAMMAMIMQTTDRDALARACELGVAMQLTNIARDVGEDARAGRLFLPRAWLRDAGIDPDAWLAAPVFTPAIAQVVRRLLDAADALYQRAERGVAALPRDCRPAIQSARLVYAEIGREIERHGLDSISRRAVVSKQRKLALIARAFAAAVQAPATSGPAPAPLGAIRYLVDAAHAAAPVVTPATAEVRTRAPVSANDESLLPTRDSSFYERTIWVIELCERAGERRRLAAMATSPSRGAVASGWRMH